MTTPFRCEAEFEAALIDLLTRHGWSDELLSHPTEQQLIDNWASILYANNRGRDLLGDVPLTEGEMAQIIEQINVLRTPLALNEFINGRTVTITRDAPQAHNFGVEVSLKIYDRLEIAGGQSRYQIAVQPRFKTADELLPKRRGDLMLLINGMPVFHIELKRSGVPVSQGANQVAKYAHEGVYQGIFSLVQIFVAMTPEETLYFANPGSAKFNPDYFFHWADFNNEPVNQWDDVARALLSIPMAHQLIGFYTVADRASGNLLAMRSYQYYAASRIADRVDRHDWDSGDQLGGYVWHTTGSGKTITSFKTAQLIADSHNADKVVFLLDRVELGTQSLENYESYGGDSIAVEDTSSAATLITLLKNKHSTLIVTSLHKMSRVNADSVKKADLDIIRSKRVVFIVDEAHRTTFGDMLATIKRTLPNALFFGFTGTPIHDENQKKHSTTTTLFGNELHRYSIADGIRDGNVLGFDPEMVETFRAHDVRSVVALQEAKAASEAEALADPKKAAVYYKFMDKDQVPMASVYGTDADSGTKRVAKGIEDYLPITQYRQDNHRQAVARDINEHWAQLSRGSMFHAILATSSIPEAVEYYRIFKAQYPHIKVTALFDPNIDNTGDSQLFKEDGLLEILRDYNAAYGQHFTMPTHDEFKKDVSKRLAHKAPYNTKAFLDDRSQHIDLLIVVDQMLTGFDSKWLNTLYMDKVIEYESIIQAFSRTNRIFGPEKPFGSIRYYRKPHTMKNNIDRAVKLYSGDKPFGLFVDHLDEHLKAINECFATITALFTDPATGQPEFSKLPDSEADKGEFAKTFNRMYRELQAAQVQGFTWEKDTYYFNALPKPIVVTLTEDVFTTLLTRYKELGKEGGDPTDPPGGTDDAPFDIDVHITHIDTDRIDAEYLNSKFEKYLKALQDGVAEHMLDDLLEQLHDSFARLSQDDQRYANRWLHDLQAGDVALQPGKTVQDYINEYRITERDRQLARLHERLGLDTGLLRRILDSRVTAATINEYGRFDDLKASIDLDLATAYFTEVTGAPVSKFKVRAMLDKLLRTYIIDGVLPADLTVAEEELAGE